MTRWYATPLWQRVLAGMALGVALGLLAPAAAASIAIVGELFVRLIKMLVVPVVIVTIAAGVAALGDTRRLGGIGGRTIGLFAITTLVAVTIGMAAGLLIRPGAGIALAGVTAHPLGTPTSLHDQLIGIVPANIFDALAKGDMLAIIFVALLLGAGCVLAGDAGRPLVAVLQSLSAVLIHIVRLVMELTPFGVLSLIASAVAANGIALFASVGWLALAVVLASVAQMGVHAALIRFAARLPVQRFFTGIVDALAVGFATASSSASIPAGLRVGEENLGVARPVLATVLPIGASIGKDGTALYVGLIGQFALQLLGIALTPAMLAVMLATGALAAFGTAPIPSASLFMMAAMLSAVGVGPDQTALVIGLILPFDRLLDMTRTVPSVSANLTVATLVARAEGSLDERVMAKGRAV